MLPKGFQFEARRIEWRRQEMAAGRVTELIELGRRVKWREARVAPTQEKDDV